jgi:ribosomal-protein-alanine N-acetyltransferase
LEIRQVGPADADLLAQFFELLKARGIEQTFHPHSLTADAARERANYCGNDLYVVLCGADGVLGYGMLRGWDEGHVIPSLGIAIHPDAQDQGLGHLLMDFLRAAAKRRGANKIRLRVAPDNKRAVSLYRSLGYEMAPEESSPYLIGFLDLSASDRKSADVS